MPRRVVILGGGVIGVEFASILQHFGSEVTIVEMLDSLIPTEDADAVQGAAARVQEARHHHAPGRPGHPRSSTATTATLHFEASDGTAGQVEADLVLVATGRGPNVDGHRPGTGRRRLRPAQRHRHRPGTCAPTCRTSSRPATWPASWQLAHTSFREGEVAAENAARPRRRDRLHGGAALHLHRSRGGRRGPDRGAGARAPRRRGRGRAHARSRPTRRAQMYAEKTGWVKTIHETRYGELLGLVIVGPQATELVNAGVVGISAEATIETIGDSIAAHPTLAEAVKEAALVALGRPIHLPPAQAPRQSGRRPVSGVRASQFLIPTLKDDPADAEAISHKLLVRGGLHPPGRTRALHLPAAGLAGDAADRPHHPRGDGHDRPGHADAGAEPGRAVAAHRPLGHPAAVQADRLLRASTTRWR